MKAGKFAAIIRKVSEHVRLDGSAKLTFEVSDGIQPMQLFCAGTPSIADGAIRVSLQPRASSCKPRDCSLAEQSMKAASCCGPASSCGA
jgi:hypothetical protein